MQKSVVTASQFSVGIYLFLCAAVLLATVSICDGHFSYSLDDPYIHLALSERLWHGSYGINAGEVSAPSSSILWPFLLAPFAGQSWNQFVPLALNLLLGSAAAWMLGRFLDSLYLTSKRKPSAWQRALVSLLMVVAANLVGLTFVGMEHVLQVLLAIGCAIGILKAFDGSPIPAWCLGMAVLAPAVRYEDLALTLAVTLTLWFQKRCGTAAAVFGSSLLLLLVFGLSLHAHGLPILPNSVLSKGGIYNADRSPLANLLWVPITNLGRYFTQFLRWPMLILLSVMVLVASSRRHSSQQKRILWSCCLTLALAILVGQWGWFYRYEVYAEIFGLLIVFGVLSTSERFTLRYAMALAIASGGIYSLAIFSTPYASRQIYRQQYQMHRFLDDYYRQNVAINDLGWVSYRASPKIYILDLVGLGSNEALVEQDKDAAWLDQVTRKHNVGLAMIYADWFPDIPDSWILLGTLSEKPYGFFKSGVLARNDVVFYATPIGDREKIRAELREFQKTLPEETSMTITAKE